MRIPISAIAIGAFDLLKSEYQHMITLDNRNTIPGNVKSICRDSCAVAFARAEVTTMYQNVLVCSEHVYVYTSPYGCNVEVYHLHV